MALFGIRSGTGTSATAIGALLTLGRRAPKSAAALEPDCGEPQLTALRASAAAGDWPALREQLSVIPDGADRTWLLAHTAKVPGIEQWITEVIAAEPDCALALLVSGARHVEWAWEARTRAPAEYVSKERFRLFHERLRIAEEQLYLAAQREPKWPSPWYFLQPAGRGLQVGPELARRRFEATVRRCPGHLDAHRQHLQQLCLKWGGSHEEMHAFARQSMLAAPGGSPLGELVAIAHLEAALDADASFTSYMQQPGVREEVAEAADRSVRHPDHRPATGWVETYNTFALALGLVGEKAAAAELFEALGGIVTPFPWAYLNAADPVGVFRTWLAAVRR